MFKKIICVSFCLILLLSIWLVPVSAVEYVNNYVDVGTAFVRAYDNQSHKLFSKSGTPLQLGVNPKVYYIYEDLKWNDKIDNVYTNFTININPAFIFKKGIEYTISFDVAFPTAYLHLINWARGGLYNWASVDFSNPFADSNYTYVGSGCIVDLTTNFSGMFDSANWKVFQDWPSDNLSLYPCKVTFTPAQDINFKSIFWSLGIARSGFISAVGISSPLISYSYNGEQYEEEQAGSQGGADIDNALSALPNDSDKFVNSLSNLANAVSYSGTDAKLTIPAMYIPAMSGMGNRINLTKEIEFNFSPYIQMIPSSILLVIQIIFTLALIVYCFKELYDIIQMVMVNKGGGE